MRVTYRGDYALKVVLALALNYGKDVVTIHELAKRIDAPIKFLEQVLLDLKKGGFVESRRGKMGGYRLARPPGNITVGQVIRFIDGPTEPISCVRNGYSSCGDMYKCVFRKVWQDVAKTTSDIIDNVTFEALAFEADSEQEVLVYSI
ncbi:MAG: Rrf2 family transcriptional regulator [Candidatus Omnitrophica bacterium]|nr:Rrf2 family transcriptional regulator [Candidatus Omnitrophota bacterium]MBU1808502.1 Rrf2 family transcriptional regulator [Candidatus Omnitrophota bacterium]